MSFICNYAGCDHQLRQTVFYNVIRHLIHIVQEVKCRFCIAFTCFLHSLRELPDPILFQLNSAVVVLSAIIAFEPYRRAILSIIGKRKLLSIKVQPFNDTTFGISKNVEAMVNHIALMRMRK